MLSWRRMIGVIVCILCHWFYLWTDCFWTMILGHDFHILLFLLLLLLFRWCCCFWFCHFIITLFFFLLFFIFLSFLLLFLLLLFLSLLLLLLLLLSLLLLLLFIKFVLVFYSMLGYFSVKLLVSSIIYVRDICLPVYVTFYYCCALDTTFLAINSLTYTISL